MWSRYSRSSRRRRLGRAACSVGAVLSAALYNGGRIVDADLAVERKRKRGQQGCRYDCVFDETTSESPHRNLTGMLAGQR